VVGPAKGRAATSVRLGWSSADGAGNRGRRGGRPGYKPGWDLDPHRLLPVEPTVLASPRSLSQFGLVRLVSAGRRADAARLRRHRQGPLGPTSAGPSAAATEGWSAATQAKTPGASQGSNCWWRVATHRLRRSCAVLSGGKLTGPQDSEAAHHAWWRRAGIPTLDRDLPSCRAYPRQW
jgi:hypothetical protein